MESKLLALPPELRNRIYELVVLSEEPLLIPSACKHANEPSSAQPPLTRVNRQLRRECLPMFYRQNKFAAHIHRCDFGYLIAWMDDIGLSNRSQIRYVKLDLKDRWTCGKGVIEFFRWCVKADGTNDMNMDYTVHSWNLEHADWMTPEQRKEMLHEPGDYDEYMGRTVYTVAEAVILAQTMLKAGRISERQLRQAWQAKLSELGFGCGSECFADAWNHTRDMGDDFRGYCSDRFRLTDNKTALAKGCRHY